MSITRCKNDLKIQKQLSSPDGILTGTFLSMLVQCCQAHGKMPSSWSCYCRSPLQQWRGLTMAVKVD